MKEELPNSWTTSPIGALGQWEGGGTPSKAIPRYWNGRIPWVSPKDMKSRSITDAEDHVTDEAIENSAATLLPAGTVLMVTRSGILAHTFPVGVTRSEVAVNQDLKALIPYEGLDAEYVGWALRRFERDILDTCTKHGTTVHSAETPRLKQFEIPIAPTNEQRRIVEKIDELFSDIEEGERALERAHKLLDRYRQAVLKAAVSGELTKDWRERHTGEIESGEAREALLSRILKTRRVAWEQSELAKMRAKGQEPKDDGWKQKYREPAPPDVTDLPPLPSGWVWTTVEQASIDVTYGSSAKCDEDAIGVPVLRMGNIVEGALDTESLKYLPAEHDEFPDLLLETGDLLFNRTNSAELVGKSAVYDGRFDCCSFASYLIRVRTVGLSSKFLSMYINSEFGRTWVRSVVSQQVGQANVNGRKLQSLAVPLPPTAEQRAIIEAYEELESASRHARMETEAQMRHGAVLRQSILTAAFSGKLVPQDQSDEPASVLLDRIRAERAATGKQPRRGRQPGKAPKAAVAPELPLASTL